MKETQRIALFHALKHRDLSTVQKLATEDKSLLTSSLGSPEDGRLIHSTDYVISGIM